MPKHVQAAAVPNIWW